ncbi:MAG: AmmeMemoRadiSam system protein B [Spirochaetes bacterium]|nr:AmmeMemoRadiSam system protein B [Spirochaetota bacterium]
MWHRKPAVAGSFYPSNPEQLKRDIELYLNNVPDTKLSGEITGVISPHAGYMYSGQIAAHAYKQLIGSGAELVIVLAPSHRARFTGASVIDSGIYETPLGGVEIDEKTGRALLSESYFSFFQEAHTMEHSLEVQVPFLQYVLGTFSIVPVIVSAYDINSARILADGLYNVLKDDRRKTVIVISTDLSHYHSYDTARELDNTYADALAGFDIGKIDNIIASRGAEACGHGPVMTGLFLCKKMGAGKVDILRYANSGDTSGNKREVVGYLAAAITK